MNLTEGLDSFFSDGVPALARAAGTTETVTRRVLAAGLPRQLDALAHQAALPEGRAHLGEAVATLPAFASVAAALAESDGAQNLEQAGALLSPALLGDHASELARAAAQEAGAESGVATRLLHLALPLLLSRLGQSGLTTHNAAEALGGLRGQPLLLAGLVGAGVAGTASLGASPVHERVVVTPAPVAPAPVPVGPPPQNRRRPGWLWLLPLLLLLLLGGCWLLQRRPATVTDRSTTVTTTTTSLSVTSPAADATLPAAPFTMTGQGPAGATLAVLDGETEVATTTVGSDGAWTLELPAPEAGAHTYTAQSGELRQAVNVTVADEAGAQTDPATDPAPGTDSTEGDPAANPSEAGYSISEPQADATLPAGGLALRGTGETGQTIEVFEDDTSLGTLAVGDDGAWAFTVPSPASGPHTYSIRGADGAARSSVNVTVGAPEAGASAANCTEDYTLSIGDGQEVNQPFRFGGVGEGTGYSVTVRRGDRVIGRKDISLDASCGWSYQSRPGAGAITYEVRALGDAAAEPLSTINLRVR